MIAIFQRRHPRWSRIIRRVERVDGHGMDSTSPRSLAGIGIPRSAVLPKNAHRLKKKWLLKLTLEPPLSQTVVSTPDCHQLPRSHNLSWGGNLTCVEHANWHVRITAQRGSLLDENIIFGEFWNCGNLLRGNGTNCRRSLVCSFFGLFQSLSCRVI